VSACAWWRGLIAAALLAGPAWAQAESLRFCDPEPTLGIGQQDQLLRFGAVVKAELERSGQPLALVARSGLDLGWFGHRYSHAGISLQASPNGPWSVRQLYYACEEGRPRLFDQGIAGFLLGTQDPAVGYVSMVFLPPEAGQALERAALSRPQALQLLAATYSANAYPFSQLYQNCNQWVMELMAAAWGGVALDEEAVDDDHPPRAKAQAWLRDQGYEPTAFALWRPLTWLTVFSPWLHRDDHPAEDLSAATFRVSMPASIEAFVHRQWPGATRVEVCHAGPRVVVRRGWAPIAPGCVPEEGDEVVMLD
jgi:hypothetical protein